MKTIVTYMSQTGNTKRIAESIFEGLEEEKDLREMGEVSSLDGYDLAFVGFPIMGNGVPEPAEKFLKSSASGKKVALFMTHAVPEGFESLEGWIGKCKDAASASEIVGVFDCQGELAQPMIEALLQSDDPQMRAFAEIGPMTKGQPDESRIGKARDFAKEIQAKAR
jgi:flavodoxin